MSAFRLRKMTVWVILFLMLSAPLTQVLSVTPAFATAAGTTLPAASSSTESASTTVAPTAPDVAAAVLGTTTSASSVSTAEPYISGVATAGDSKLSAAADDSKKTPFINIMVYRINDNGSRVDIPVHPGSDPAHLAAIGALNEEGATATDGTFTTDGGLNDGHYLVMVLQGAKDYADTAKGKLASATGMGAIGATVGLGIGAAICTLVTAGWCAAALIGGTLLGGGAASVSKLFEAGNTAITENTEGTPYYYAAQNVEISDGKVITPALPVVLAYQEVTVSPVAIAVGNAITVMGDFLQKSIKLCVNATNALLFQTKNYVLGVGVESAWIKIRNIAMVLLVLGLIIIAFANMFQVDIEQYGLNRMIPRIIISIIMAYFSWIIVMFFFDFTSAIQQESVTILNHGMPGINTLGNINMGTPGAIELMSAIGSYLLAIAVIVIALFSCLVLVFSLFIRIIFLSFLLAIAPLAFMLNIMPFSQNLYKQWWSEFFKWMFMGPMAVAIIALGTVIAIPDVVTSGAAAKGLQTTLDASLPTSVDLMIRLGILAAAIYFAGTLPKQWGGDIMKGWQGLGKKATNWGKGLVKGGAGLAGKGIGFGLNQSGVTGAWTGWRKNADDRRKQVADRNANRLLNKIPGGRNGMDQGVFERNQQASILNAESKRYEFGDKSQFTSAFQAAKNDTARQAILLAAMRAGMVDDSETGIGQRNIVRLAEADNSGLLMAGAMKDHREALVKEGSSLAVRQRAAEDIVKKFSTAKGGELRAVAAAATSTDPDKRISRGEVMLPDGTKMSGIDKLGSAIGQSSINKLRETNPDSANALQELTGVWGGPARSPNTAATMNEAYTENARHDADTKAKTWGPGRDGYDD